GIGFELTGEETGALRKLALAEEVSLFMVISALYNVFLSRISGMEDIVVGTPLAGRGHADLHRVIGMFVTIMPFRNRPGGEKSFKTLLAEVKDTTLKVFENQDYPFENLVERFAPERDPGRNALFDAVFSFNNVEMQAGEVEEAEIHGLKIRPYPYEKKISKYDLVLHGVETADILSFTMDYSTKLFKEETVRRFITYFKDILSAVIKNKHTRLKDIDVTYDLADAGTNLLIEDEGDFGF
ncbi:MAG: hypothetical protein GY771_03400, partial [bacterium]|nr:hypothetical protein [bacterium]